MEENDNREAVMEEEIENKLASSPYSHFRKLLLEESGDKEEVKSII